LKGTSPVRLGVVDEVELLDELVVVVLELVVVDDVVVTGASCRTICAPTL
jgi:hypothetical protein